MAPSAARVRERRTVLPARPGVERPRHRRLVDARARAHRRRRRIVGIVDRATRSVAPEMTEQRVSRRERRPARRARRHAKSAASRRAERSSHLTRRSNPPSARRFHRTH